MHALAGVVVGLGMRPRSTSAKGHPFVSILDDVLIEMDQRDILEYAFYCRDTYE